MAKRYPPEMREIIWACLGDGLKPAEIRRKLSAGIGGLPPMEVPDRTLREYVTKLRLERGNPSDSVESGKELEETRLILNQLVTNLKRETRRISSRSLKRGLEPSEIVQLEKLTRLATDAEKRLSSVRKAKESIHSPATEAVLDSPRESSLAALVATKPDPSSRNGN